jgi:hypothetical protein
MLNPTICHPLRCVLQRPVPLQQSFPWRLDLHFSEQWHFGFDWLRVGSFLMDYSFLYLSFIFWLMRSALVYFTVSPAHRVNSRIKPISMDFFRNFFFELLKFESKAA